MVNVFSNMGYPYNLDQVNWEQVAKVGLMIPIAIILFNGGYQHEIVLKGSITESILYAAGVICIIFLFVDGSRFFKKRKSKNTINYRTKQSR
jgi:hypothetical protein